MFSSIAEAPVAMLGVIVGASSLIRAGIGVRVPAPWILPDEIVYSDLAKSIAGGHRPAVRGVPVFGWGEVYPAVVAPAWALIDNPVHAYHAALALSALLMSLAAVPAYLLARMFVSRSASYVVAGMTVLVPSMAYTGAVMTENAFYPVFLVAVLLIARSLRRPTLASQASALGGLVLVAFTRIQGLALVGAYLFAILIHGLTQPSSYRRAYLRRFVASGVVLVAAPLAPVAVSLARGDGAFGWLGSRSGTFAEFHLAEVPEWFAYLTGDLVLYVAVVPIAATALVVAHGLSRRSADQVRLFAALALPTFAAMIASVSLVSASLDVDGTENLNERYLFYVVPLAFVGLALWIQEGLPRHSRWARFVVALGCTTVVIIPIDRLHHNSGFQSLALVPWIVLPVAGLALALLVGLFTLACGALWARCAPDHTGRLWMLVGTWMAFVGLLAVGSNAVSAEDSAHHAFGGQAATWVDDAVPRGAEVAVVWDQRAAPFDRPDQIAFRLMGLEELNASIGHVYRVGRPTYYEVFLPTRPLVVRADRTLVDRHGRTLRARYVLAPSRTPVEGKVLAIGSRGALRVIEVYGPVRLAAVRT